MPAPGGDQPVRRVRLDALAYGGDYNPDQWSEETWHEDIRLMREAGVNMVSLPIFSWPQLEPEPGVFDWALARPHHRPACGRPASRSTSPPPRRRRRRGCCARTPRWRRGMPTGHRLEFGSRQTYCPSSPIWRENVARMARAMADRYGTHPGLAMWHISNEYGDHTSRCWCPESARHFRRWLQHRYGDLDGLNDAWGVNVLGSALHLVGPHRDAEEGAGPDQPDAAARLRAVLVGRPPRAVPGRDRRAARGHPRPRRSRRTS